MIKKFIVVIRDVLIHFVIITNKAMIFEKEANN